MTQNFPSYIYFFSFFFFCMSTRLYFPFFSLKYLFLPDYKVNHLYPFSGFHLSLLPLKGSTFHQSTSIALYIQILSPFLRFLGL